MATYQQFCDRYGLDPATPEAQEQFAEYREQLALLESLTGVGDTGHPSPDPVTREAQ